MLSPERLPHTLLLAAPLALLLAGRTPVATPGAAATAVRADSVAGWATTHRPPMASLERDTTEKHGGSASGHLVAAPAVPAASGHGGGQPPRVMPIRFVQTLNAQPYRERRIRVSMWVRTRLPDKPASKMPLSQAATFMRIENEDGTHVSYDGNVSPLLGSTEWTRKFIVLEVPPDAFALSFGLAVTGPGEVWVDDVILEDQGQAMGSYDKQPLVPPGRLAQLTPEQLEQGKEMLARRIAWAKSRPAEVTNGDFEAK